jgi:hypothetical protein
MILYIANTHTMQNVSLILNILTQLLSSVTTNNIIYYLTKEANGSITTAQDTPDDGPKKARNM